MDLPGFNEIGDLPGDVHEASLEDVVARFGVGTQRRVNLGIRLQGIHRLALQTGFLARFIVFGSFVTAKPEPGDVDVFMLMEDDFDVARVTGDAKMLFDYPVAKVHFGASIFWLRGVSTLGGEQYTIDSWQYKRDGGWRGIVEIVSE
ncbi:MAG: hypothetical protein IIC85_12210 [Chloroflexi bacterium]|nr:hypothetical protein [Chloroflexota bacterium]